jgi:hypothetical protein
MEVAVLRNAAPLTGTRSAVKVLLCLLAAALVAAGPANAQTTRHVRHVIPISDTFTSDFLSDQCGFEVVISVTGTLNVRLFYNDSGLIVRELDTTASGSKITYSAPSTGESFSHPNSLTVNYDYGAGATVGSPVTIRVTGLFGHVTGLIPSDAGMQVFSTGVVEGFDELGIPEVDFGGEPTVEHGNREPGEQILTSLCASLSGP